MKALFWGQVRYSRARNIVRIAGITRGSDKMGSWQVSGMVRRLITFGSEALRYQARVEGRPDPLPFNSSNSTCPCFPEGVDTLRQIPLLLLELLLVDFASCVPLLKDLKG